MLTMAGETIGRLYAEGAHAYLRRVTGREIIIACDALAAATSKFKGVETRDPTSGDVYNLVDIQLLPMSEIRKQDPLLGVRLPGLFDRLLAEIPSLGEPRDVTFDGFHINRN